MKSDRENTIAVSSQRGGAHRRTILQANKMPPRQNSDRVFQRALHSAFASKANQLLHKQRAQMTSAHHSKPLRETDAHEWRRPMQRSATHCTATRHGFEMLRDDLRSKRIHGMRQKLGDESWARAFRLSLLLSRPFPHTEFLTTTFAHACCAVW
jgi:hypothetical protein